MDKILKFIKDKGRYIYDIPSIDINCLNTCLELAKEEPAELIQATTKMKRIEDRKILIYRNILDENLRHRGEDRPELKKLLEAKKEVNDLQEKYKDNLCEEIADVINIILMLFNIYDVQEDEVLKWLNKKYDRMMKRIKEGDFY